MTVEAFAERVLSERVQEAPPEGSTCESFWKSFTRDVHNRPDSVFERLPADGASEHDHSLIRRPKRNS